MRTPFKNSCTISKDTRRPSILYDSLLTDGKKSPAVPYRLCTYFKLDRKNYKLLFFSNAVIYSCLASASDGGRILLHMLPDNRPLAMW